jgi:sugar/nucleoside kinase (ribokinase family)
VYNNGNKASIVSKIPPLDSRLFDLTFLEKTRALHIGGYLLIPSLWGNNIRRLLRKADRENVVISLDPQMSATGQWSKAFRGVFEHLHVLLLDEMEAIRISKKKRLGDAIEHLHRKGVQTVAVKAGSKGCVVSNGGKVYSVKGLEPKVVSTIGAGDAFDAAFIYGVLKNWPLRKIAQFSNTAASVSTTQLGCATALPRAKDLERLVDAYYR